MNSLTPIENVSQHYCVWFVSGTTPGQLRYHRRLLQLFQDMLVVEALNEHDALEKAVHLLRRCCEYPSFITRVLSRAELVRMLGVLDRVDAGTVPAATEMDMDHFVWVTRYLEPVCFV